MARDACCHWCDEPREGIGLCRQCVPSATPYLDLCLLVPTLMHPPRSWDDNFRKTAWNAAEALARSSTGTWSERVRSVSEGILGRLVEGLQDSGLSREEIQIA